MDDRLAAVAATHGTFFRHEAIDLGYTDRQLAAARRAGAIHRVKQGAYTTGDLWRAADDIGRHRILARTVLRLMPDRVALSLTSSLVERGVLTWGVDLSKVHVTRLDGGAGRVEKDSVHHQGRLTDDDVEEVNGLLVVRAARGLVESCSWTDLQRGLVMADSALHQGLLTPDEFSAAYRAFMQWPKARVVQLVHRLADGRAESPGETRARYLCWTQGIPIPELQFKVYDENGVLVAVTDFAWHSLGVLGEFDGRVKYGRNLRPGQDPGQAVFEEKVREDLVRELTNRPMVRFIWSDFADPRTMAGRVWRLSRRSAQLP